MTLLQIKLKKILFITGTRADYGKLEPLARACQIGGFQISFFITGMHMMKKYGETRLEVRQFPNAEFFEFVNQREGDPLDLILSKTIFGFSDFVHEHRPDLVVIHGDRVEALAASIVCAMRYIRSAHIEGGEVSGNIDESIRHCNTKLCTSHFVCSVSAGERVRNLGEDPNRIFIIGSPELDTHSRETGVSIEVVKSRYGIPFDTYGVVIFHPVTSEVHKIGDDASSLFKTLKKSNKKFVVIAPNNDPGNDQIFSVLETLPKTQFRVLPSMRFSYFSELMKNAAIMIGNSSAGVREAPFLGLPSIDLGNRQRGRSCSPSVFFADPSNSLKIRELIETNWLRRYKPSFENGDGNASKTFLSILNQDTFWKLPREKYYTEVIS